MDAEREVDHIRRAKAGDVAAFERLYRAHLPRVHRVARWLLGTDDVDDVVQDVFIRTWSKLHTFNGDATLGTWLYRLATNVVLRHRERRRKHGARESHLDEGSALPTRLRVDLRLDLESAVTSLPEGARSVFVLHEIEGYRHPEIAEMLSIGVATSRSQLHRARVLMRRQLREKRA